MGMIRTRCWTGVLLTIFSVTILSFALSPAMAIDNTAIRITDCAGREVSPQRAKAAWQTIKKVVSSRNPKDCARAETQSWVGLPPPKGTQVVTDVTCEEVSIICEGVEGGGASCMNDPSTPCSGCIIFIPVPSCQLLGLTSGMRLTPRELRERALATEPTTEAEASMQCQLVHEIRHAIDGPDAPDCATERDAFREQSDCLNTYYQRYCANTPPLWSSEECAKLYLQYALKKAASRLQGCRCDTNHQDRQACESCRQMCIDEVRALYPHLPDERIQELANGYCRSIEERYCLRIGHWENPCQS